MSKETDMAGESPGPFLLMINQYLSTIDEFEMFHVSQQKQNPTFFFDFKGGCENSYLPFI